MILANISRFTGGWSKINKMGEQLKISRLGLARCVMTVGQSGYSKVLNQDFWRLCSLFSLTYSNVDSIKGKLTLSDTFNRLQQSEKTTVSYHLGMGLTKACSEILMKIPWLIHLKDISGVVLGTSLGQVPTKFQLYASKKTAREPDLIGFDSNKNSHVFEAKGYSSGVNTSELQHAIDQVSQVVAINGVPPSTRTVVYSDLSSSPFLVTIIDPEDNESHGYRIEFKFNSFLRSYYSVFADIEKWTDTLFEAEIGGYSFRVFPIGNSDYFFGIATYVLEQLKDVFHSDTTDSFSILNTVNQEILDDTLSIGYDGTILFNILSKSILHLK